MIPRVRLVVHAQRVDGEVVRRVLARGREVGLAIDVRPTFEPGDAAAIAEESARVGVKTLLACGGDGTLNEVISGVVASGRSSRCTVGVVPLGTANDFAVAHGLPLDPMLAFEVARTSLAVPIDLAQMNGRLFVNVATGGFSAKLARRTSPAIKKLLGRAAYLLTGVLHFGEVGAQRAELRGPGVAWSGELLALGVGNARLAGGGLPVCPAAMIDDGMLDVAVLPSLGEPDAITLLEALAVGGFAGLETQVQRARVPWLEIESDDEVHVNVDGEPLRARTLRFDVLPRAIRVHLPPSSPLLSPRRRRSRARPEPQLG